MPCEEHACHDCCLDIEMILTEADVVRLRAAVAARWPGTADAAWSMQAEDGFLQLRTRTTPLASDAAAGIAALPCWFLGEDGRCMVWDARPEGCRLYPAVWDEGADAAILDDVYCPHTDGFRLPRAMDDATRRLAARLESERSARSAAADG